MIVFILSCGKRGRVFMGSKLSTWVKELLETIQEKWRQFRELPGKEKFLIIKRVFVFIFIAALIVGTCLLSELPPMQVAGPAVQTENEPSSELEESSSSSSQLESEPQSQ